MTARKIPFTQVEGGEKPFTVRDLISYALRIDVRFNSTYDGIGKALRIADAVKVKPGEMDNVDLLVDEGDWQTVCDALKSPSPLSGNAPYPLAPGHACMPLVEAVLNAKPEGK
jgi:hypothetical protein